MADSVIATEEATSSTEGDPIETPTESTKEGDVAISDKVAETFGEDPDREDTTDPDEAGSEAAQAAEEPPATTEPPEPPSTDSLPDADKLAHLNPLQKLALERVKLDASDLESMDPEAQARMADRLHGSFNEVSNQFAAIGRARRAKGITEPLQTASIPSQDAADAAALGKSGVEGKASADQQLREIPDEEVLKRFGLPTEDEVRNNYDDEMVDSFFKPVLAVARTAAKLEDAFKVLLEERSTQEAVVETQNNQTQEADQFFRNQTALEHLYGKGQDWVVEPKQYDLRKKVCDQAEDIIAGAETSGTPITLTEGLARAQSIVLEPHITNNARAEGAEQTATRKNRSLHPPARPVKPTDDDEESKHPDAKARAAIGETAKRLGMRGWDD